jgi:hypothetical protein
VDLKTGQPSTTHADDLRLYAVLETLRVGVPPFRLASYYLDSGTWHAEDVTEDVLTTAMRRLVGGVAKVVELRFEGRPATLAPGPACHYCPARRTCDGAAVWAERRRRSRDGTDDGAGFGDDAVDEDVDEDLDEDAGADGDRASLP